MSNDYNSKDAFFALETTFEEDMAQIGEDTTRLAIKHINGSPELYNHINTNNPASLKDSCVVWAEEHNDEFGDLFISELDGVDWERVLSRV